MEILGCVHSDEIKAINLICATKAQIKDLTDRVDHFSSIEHIDKLVNEFMPKVEQFADHLEDFLGDNDDVKECIKKFD